MNYSSKILDRLDKYKGESEFSMNVIKAVMIQSTGNLKAEEFYNNIDTTPNMALAHIVFDGESAVSYAKFTDVVIDPINTSFTERAKQFIDPLEENDSPANYIVVMEISTYGDDYASNEKKAIEYLASFLSKWGLTTDNVWRRYDLINDNVKNSIQYNKLNDWNKVKDSINYSIENPNDYKATGITIPNTSDILPEFDDRIINIIRNIFAFDVSAEEDFETMLEYDSVVIDRFTGQPIHLPKNGLVMLYEPNYPDLTVSPKTNTNLYDKRILNINEEKDAEKIIAGAIVNNTDPYPVDTKIIELQQASPTIKKTDDEIILPGSPCCEDCTLKLNDSVLKSHLIDVSRKTESRVIQLEQITSTLMRYFYRLSSRLNINCVYYGGQASYYKYNCIRCLNDDLIEDKAIVQIDQCLNCSRYEPIIGQVYDILDEHMMDNLAIKLDDNQMSRVDMIDKITNSTIESISTEKEKAHIKVDEISISPDNNIVEEPGFIMDWTPVASPGVDINKYSYNPETIKTNKDEIILNKDKSGYQQVIKENISKPYQGSSGGSLGLEGTSFFTAQEVREKIVEEAKRLLQLCKDGKGRYSQTDRYKVINNILYLDCSSFAYTCYKAAGITGNMPQTSRTQYDYCVSSGETFTDLAKALPGDLIFYNRNGAIGHVSVYIGGGECIHASTSNTEVTNQWKKSNWKGENFVAFGRTKELLQADKEANSASVNNISSSLEQAVKIQMSLSSKPQIYSSGSWINATYNQVLNAMNPALYLTAPSIYQFMALNRKIGLTESEVKAFLKSKNATNDLIDNANEFIKAANDFNVNELYLISHCCLETGNGTSAYATGRNKHGDVPIYNMYGISVFDSNPSAGISYAYNKGWTTQAKAIYGGAQWIKSNYLTKQVTLYEMRWNPNDPGKHQYATDIDWAIKQAKIMSGAVSYLTEESKQKITYIMPYYYKSETASKNNNGAINYIN